MNPDCRACEGIEPLTPESVANRPGLPALRYRVGRHSSFLESMIARLSAQFEAPAAPGDDSGRIDAPSRPTGAYRLQTREPGDPSIALLDAWATVGDVLSFYQERIANEGYLRTAREERSLHELAGLVGYKLRPALSSSVHLAFDVQKPPALDPNVEPPKPHNVLIPKGTHVKSIPASGELPQAFETSEKLIARPEWNTLAPFTTQPTHITKESANNLTKLRFDRVDHNLRAGDLLLLVPSAFSSDAPAQAVPVIRKILSVAFDTERKQTVVQLVLSPLSSTAYRDRIATAALRLLRSDSQILNLTEAATKQFDIWRSVASDFTTNKNVELHDYDKQMWSALIATHQSSSLLKIHKNYTDAINTISNVFVASDNDIQQKLLVDSIRSLPNRFASNGGRESVNSSCLATIQLTAYLRALGDVANDVATSATTDVNKILNARIGFTPDDPPRDDGSLQWFADAIDSIRYPNLRSGINEFHLSLRNVASADEFRTVLGSFVHQSTSETATEAINETVRVLDGDLFGRHLMAIRTELDNSPWSGPAEGRFDQANLFERHELESACEQLDNWANLETWKSTPSHKVIELFAGDTAHAIANARADALKEAIAISKLIQTYLLRLSNTLPPNLDRLVEMLPQSEENSAREVVAKTYRIVDRFLIQKDDQLLTEFDSIDKAATAVTSLIQEWTGASKAIADEVIRQLSVFAAHDTVAELADAQKKLSDRLKEGDDSSSGYAELTYKAIDDAYNKLARSAPSHSLLDLLHILIDSLREKIEPDAADKSPRVLGFGALDTISRQLDQRREFVDNSLNSATVFADTPDVLPRLLQRLGGREELRVIESWAGMHDRSRLGKVFRFKARAGLFGVTQSNTIRIKKPVNSQSAPGDRAPNAQPENKQQEFVEDEPWRIEDEDKDATSTLYLDHEYTDVAHNGWCIVSTNESAELLGSPRHVCITKAYEIKEADIITRRAHGLSGKSMRIRLGGAWRKPWKVSGEVRDSIRSTVTFIGSEELPLVEDVVETPFPGNKDLRKFISSEIEVEDGRSTYTYTNRIPLSQFYGELETGRTIIISGEQVIPDEKTHASIRTGTIVSRVHRIVAATSEPNDSKTKIVTSLEIIPDLNIRYHRDTVRIYANVVEATQAVTFSEVLGNGEGQGAFQRFRLSQPRLAHLPAATPSGMSRQLEVRVNDVAWRNVEFIGDLSRNDSGMTPAPIQRASQEQLRNYVATLDDKEFTFITTGDGVTSGARLPTGIANVHAKYRVGGGRGGNLKEGTITQMASPPLNVAKVRNLSPSTGGVDRESIDQARKNVPVAVQALERLVSLADYESFARRFAGIAKAQATRLRTDQGNKVVVTLAGLDDVMIAGDSLLHRNLKASLQEFADPEQQVELLHRELVLLLLAARIKVHADYEFKKVEPQILRRLLETFDFEKSSLGTNVLLSDVINVIQNTAGVEYVDIEMFDSVRQRYGAADLLKKISGLADDLKGPTKKLPRTSVAVGVARFLRDDKDEVLQRKKTRKAEELSTILPAQLAYFTDLPGTILLEEIR